MNNQLSDRKVIGIIIITIIFIFIVIFSFSSNTRNNTIEWRDSYSGLNNYTESNL